MRNVEEYPSESPRKDLIASMFTLLFVFGLPVTFGCLMYVAGATKWESMLGGASMVVFPLAVLMALAHRQWRKMLRVLGSPLQSGERVQVVSGRLKGKSGTVEFPGQGGPMTLYVKMDDAPKDEVIVFSWHHLRRLI